AIFAADYNAVDGGGASVGDGRRYTRFPRADLRGTGQWFNHTPARATGPNAQSCAGCHNEPFEDGAGRPETHAVRDPLRNGLINQFIERQTPHLFGLGALQRLAEEVTTQLQGQLAAARAAGAATVALSS